MKDFKEFTTEELEELIVNIQIDAKNLEIVICGLEEVMFYTQQIEDKCKFSLGFKFTLHNVGHSLYCLCKDAVKEFLDRCNSGYKNTLINLAFADILINDTTEDMFFVRNIIYD